MSCPHSLDKEDAFQTQMVNTCVRFLPHSPHVALSCFPADETIVPPDVPSYLSSQGTLSDRQETLVRTEGGHQANGHIESNGEAMSPEFPVAPGPGQSRRLRDPRLLCCLLALIFVRPAELYGPVTWEVTAFGVVSSRQKKGPNGARSRGQLPVCAGSAKYK